MGKTGQRGSAAIVRALFSTGVRRHPSGWVGQAMGLWATGVALYVLYANTFLVLGPWQLAATFMCAMFALVFVAVGGSATSDPEKPHAMDWVFSAASAGALLYAVSQGERISNRLALFDSLQTVDILFSAAVIVLALEATRRATGLALTLLVLALSAYNLFGHLLSGVLAHGHISTLHFLEMEAMTNEGVFGITAQVAATYAFLFVMFGTLLQRCGGGEFFFDLAAAIAGRRVGGPAKVAVVSSGLFGTISGSPVADVVATGSITIPMMKRMGYSGALAGAIEVAASTGGSILPPVMGSAAFLMAEYAMIPYRQIALAAIIPALLYYFNVYAQTHFSARAHGFMGMNEVPTFGVVLRRGWLFVIPLVALVMGLMAGYTPTRVAIFGLLTLLAVGLIPVRSLSGIMYLLGALGETTIRVIPLVGAVAAAGLVLAGINITGLAGKVALLLDLISGGDLLATLIVVAAICLVLGMGMPTPSVYLLSAALMAPYLTGTLGLPTLSAHMFLLYYSCMSAVTPPVAVAAFAAAPIADANPFSIGVLAVRFCLGAFVVPFVFVYRPALLLQGNVVGIVIAALVAVLGFLCLAVAIEGYYRAKLGIPSRILVGVAGGALLVPNRSADLIGLGLLGVVVVWALVRPRIAVDARR